MDNRRTQSTSANMTVMHVAIIVKACCRPHHRPLSTWAIFSCDHIIGRPMENCKERFNGLRNGQKSQTSYSALRRSYVHQMTPGLNGPKARRSAAGDRSICHHSVPRLAKWETFAFPF